jgi:hypothetical protein
MRAVTGFGLRTPVVPRFRDSWLRRVPLVASWVSGPWLLRPQGTPAATRAPAPAAIHSADDVPAGPTHPAPQSPVPPVNSTPAAPSGAGGSGHTCPSSTHSGTHGPCGTVVADLVPSWAMPPAGPAVLVSAGGSGATAGTPGHSG